MNEQAERVQEFGVENSRLKDDWKGTQEVLRKSIEISDDYEAENTRLREALEDLRMSIHAELSPLLSSATQSYLTEKIVQALEVPK